LPFEINIPNAETKAAIKEIKDGGGKKFDNVDELFKHLGI